MYEGVYREQITMSEPKTQDPGITVLPHQDYLPIIASSFLIDRRAIGLSPDTIGFYEKKLKYFLAFC